MRWRPGIRWWLIGANGLVLLAPLAAVFGLRVYDVYLLRQTERQLIAQAVLVGEIYRESWLQESGRLPAGELNFRPPDRQRQRFIAYEPLIDIGTEIQPPVEQNFPTAARGDTIARRAGKRLESLLARAQVFNLSAVRIMDADGCVVATTGVASDSCLAGLPEVRRALGGRYAAMARERISNEPAPPLTGIRRRGKVRVFAALPVFADGRVIAVVRISRTALSALESLWFNRRGLFGAVIATGILTILTSLLFARAISSPVRAITKNAEGIVRGEAPATFVARRWVPAELQNLARSLERMTQRLRERAAYTSEFAANVSHELKTPLTAIRGAAELLREQWDGMKDEQRERFIANIDADVVRMERLVNRLLNLARIENAPLENQESILVAEFCDELAARYGPRIELRREQPPAIITIHSDHLASAVCNLIDNALQHGGGGLVRVKVKGHQQNLRVEVADRGPGISPANQKKIFQRFFTTQRDHGGTGLGLAIVKAVADARGGRVTVETNTSGTTFALDLPLGSDPDN